VAEFDPDIIIILGSFLYLASICSQKVKKDGVGRQSEDIGTTDGKFKKEKLNRRRKTRSRKSKNPTHRTGIA
jgi:hypothetical protein